MTTDVAAVAVDTAGTPAGTDAPVANMGDLKKAVEARDTLKKERDALAAKIKGIEEAQMTEQQKLAARIAELEPVATKAARMETVVGALLEQELATVPEEMRDVVPQTLAPEEKLDWLRQAKAKGLFKATEPPPKPTNAPLGTRPAAGGGTTITKSALAEMPNGPRRAATMQAIREGKLAVIDG